MIGASHMPNLKYEECVCLSVCECVCACMLSAPYVAVEVCTYMPPYMHRRRLVLLCASDGSIAPCVVRVSRYMFYSFILQLQQLVD